MAKETITFKINKQSLAEINKKALEAVFAMGFDMAAQARRNSPVVTSALRNSIRVEEDGTDVYVKAGGIVAQSTRGAKYVDYAMKREEGPNRDPATEHYMENAMHMIMTGDYMEKYFGGITK